MERDGITTLPCRHSVEEAVKRVTGLLEKKGIHLFALIDHSGEAAKAGLQMPNTKLMIFGDPKTGTPLMLRAPTLAIDLPLKLLIWEDPRESVWVSFNNPEYLGLRHDLPGELSAALGGVRSIAEFAAN